MYNVRYHTGDPEWQIDKFIGLGGHYVIVKGYKIVDGIIWFEVYDPASHGLTYNDGSLMGIDRYYRSEDIIKALDHGAYGRHAVVVPKPKDSQTQ